LEQAWQMLMDLHRMETYMANQQGRVPWR